MMTRSNSSTHFICNMVDWQILKKYSFLPFEQSPGPALTSSAPSPHSFLQLHLRSHHRSPFISVAPKDRKTSHWLTTYSYDDVLTHLLHEQPWMTWTIVSIFVLLFIFWVPHSSSFLASASNALTVLTNRRPTCPNASSLHIPQNGKSPYRINLDSICHPPHTLSSIYSPPSSVLTINNLTFGYHHILISLLPPHLLPHIIITPRSPIISHLQHVTSPVTPM